MVENREEETSYNNIEWKIENFAFIDSESIRAEWTSSFKDLYEVERISILSKLPDSYKMRFRTIGFYENKPIMIVSPYDVPHGEIRRLWMEAFFKLVHLIDKKKTKKFLRKMPHLIHDFQCRQAGPEYSVYLGAGTQTSPILTFEEGAALDLDSVPKEIQRKTMVKVNPTPLTEEERAKLRGLENMFPFVDTHNVLPWTEPPKDCDMFQFIENPPVMVQPSESVSSRANQTFGTTVMLRGPGPQKDDRYPAKIIKYHGDFTLVEYPNRQRQWLPLQNQDVEFVTVNHVGKVVSCVRSVSVEDDNEEENDEEMQQIAKNETLASATSDPSVELVEESIKDVKIETPVDIDKTALTGFTTDKYDISPVTAIETATPLRATQGSEKRSATSPIPRNAKAQKLATTDVPTTTDSLQQLQCSNRENIDESGDKRPSKQTELATTSREESKKSESSRNNNLASSSFRPPNVKIPDQGTGINTLSPARSPNNRSKINSQPRSRQGPVAYSDMTITALAERMRLHNHDITVAVLDELFRRPWNDEYHRTKISQTISLLKSSKNRKLSVGAEMVIQAWNMDHELNNLCNAAKGYRPDSVQKIHEALKNLDSLCCAPTLNFFKEALGHCNRQETLESGIVLANEYLRRANESSIPENVRVRLTGRLLGVTGNDNEYLL